ncbi:MAG: hypothetical protein LBF16_06655 [Pseudomonadales bacterium]|nr:hypothetical protein [Pseudomonadales bacterium]
MPAAVPDPVPVPDPDPEPAPPAVVASAADTPAIVAPAVAASTVAPAVVDTPAVVVPVVAAPASAAIKVSWSMDDRVPDGASVREQDGVLRFCFASANATMPLNALGSLGNVVKGVATGQTAIINGFQSGGSGEQTSQGADLTSQRMSAVHATLTALGIGDDKIEHQTSAATNPTQVRCVEIRLE